MAAKTETNIPRCSFCGKSQEEVNKLIAGPTVYICNECVDICNEIIADDEQIEGNARAKQQSVHIGAIMCPACQSHLRPALAQAKHS